MRKEVRLHIVDSVSQIEPVELNVISFIALLEIHTVSAVVEELLSFELCNS